MAPEMTALDPEQPFHFQCDPEVPCFNACCRDLVQLLTPLDVARLRTHLEMTSAGFLEAHTLVHAGPETGLPVVSLKPAPGAERECPFVTGDGCRVYPARPTSCRTYPVARAVGRDPRTGDVAEHFALIREPHCKGFASARRQTARQWLTNQGADGDFAATDGLLDVIGRKRRLRPGPLPPDLFRRCHRALYDVDGFRKALSRDPVIGGRPIDPRALRAARSDDVALIKLAVAWVRAELFGPGPH